VRPALAHLQLEPVSLEHQRARFAAGAAAQWKKSSAHLARGERGLHYFRIEPTFTAGAGSITQLGGAILDTSTAALTLVAGAGILPGVGADSSIYDWDTVQTCSRITSCGRIGVAYRPTRRRFATSPSGKMAPEKTPTSMRAWWRAAHGRRPRCRLFPRHGGRAALISYVMKDATVGDPLADLEVWQSNAPGYNWAWLSFARDNGVSSITRPRGLSERYGDLGERDSLRRRRQRHEAPGDDAALRLSRHPHPVRQRSRNSDHLWLVQR